MANLSISNIYVSQIEDMFDSRAAADVFWTIPIIGSLLNTEEFQSFSRVQFGLPVLDDNLALGYSFALSFVIQSLIDVVLRSPATFGMKENKDVVRASEAGVQYDRMPIDSSQGQFVRSLTEYYRPLMAVRTFADFEDRTKPIAVHLLPNLKKLLVYYSYNENALKKIGSPEDIQRQSAIEFLHFYFHDFSGFVGHAFKMTFGRGRHLKLHDQWIPSRIGKQEFFQGFKLALQYLWWSLLGNDASNYRSYRKISECKSQRQLDHLYRKVQREIVEPICNKSGIFIISDMVYLRASKINSAFIRKLISPPISLKDMRQTEEELLDAIFRPYPVIMVDSGEGVGCTFEFLVALKGAMQLGGGKIEVVRFVHQESDVDSYVYTRYSYSLLIPASSGIWNHYRWWVFFDFCGGTGGTGNSLHEQVEEHLVKWKSRIHSKEVVVNRDVLGRYTKSSLLSSSEDEKQRANIELAETKGIVLEILVKSILERLRYSVSWRYKSKNLINDREIDIIATKVSPTNQEILVVECQTHMSRGIINELSEKVRVIESHEREFKSEFNLEVDKSMTARGLLVTADYVHQLDKRAALDRFIIRIWDRKELIARCKKYGFEWRNLDSIFPVSLLQRLRKRSQTPRFLKFL